MECKQIKEGDAVIETGGKVFYNPVQEFNRDLSISVLTSFANNYLSENGRKIEDGITILEALSATGLRSIRYAKEIPYIKEIIANDLSIKAVEDIRRNVKSNGVENVVKATHSDAIALMLEHRHKEKQFDVIDLDPYGCPSIFLDSAIQAIKNGGLLLITATDMAVLAGNSPEACYSKYGAISLRMKCCHEMALRILLQCVESHANRYGRYIVPLLSLSADFYIRIFIRVYNGLNKCKYTLSKLSYVYHCTGCGSFHLQPLGLLKINEKTKQTKFALPTGPFVEKLCKHCNHPHHMGGPIWSAPIHDIDFVNNVLSNIRPTLGTFKRIQGVLCVIKEELHDVPLYYTLERLCGTLHVETPPMLIIRSAILNAGYRVSYTHMNRTSIKTDAPSNVIWDIMRCWERLHPVALKRLIENSPANNILKQKCSNEKAVYSFDLNPLANPESKRMGFVRFQENPLPFWGPGMRSTAMIGGGDTMGKSKRNQGKRKRELSEENVNNN